MPGPKTRIDGEPSEGPVNEGLHRRQVLVIGSAAAAACCLGASGSALAANPAPAAERPQKGDWLVIADSGEHEGKVIKLDMLNVGGAMLNAWPVDSETKTTRSKSRFNKVVVVLSSRTSSIRPPLPSRWRASSPSPPSAPIKPVR
jgi:hypothetical protein